MNFFSKRMGTPLIIKKTIIIISMNRFFLSSLFHTLQNALNLHISHTSKCTLLTNTIQEEEEEKKSHT